MPAGEAWRLVISPFAFVTSWWLDNPLEQLGKSPFTSLEM